MKTSPISAALVILALAASVYADTYVDEPGDFTITTDQGANGLDAGDTVTWSSPNLGSQTGLVFGTDAYTSIQAAVDTAIDGGTVFIARGTYAEGTQITISKNLTLQGDGADVTEVSGAEAHRVIEILEGNFDVTLDGLRIIKGSNQDRYVINGGGISQNGGKLTISNSTLADNTAVKGGGISSSGGSLIIINSTLSGNSAEYGGGIYATFNEVSVVHCTITLNTADEGDGISRPASGGPVVAVVNSVVAGNTSTTSHYDLRGDSFTSNGANFIGRDNSSNQAFAGDMTLSSTGTVLTQIIDTNLSNNGGPTPTHAFARRSLAIDAGKNNDALDPDGNALETDQRGAGFSRIGSCPMVDIGAYEVQGHAEPVVYVADDGEFHPAHPSPGDSVTWFGDGREVEDLIFGMKAFTSIQKAVDGVCPNGTVFIAHGTLVFRAMGHRVTIRRQ